MSFSIDDVRDTLRSDISRFLMHIEQTAKELLASPPLVPSGDRTTEGPGKFARIAEDGHAIFGTTSLVAAGSLSTCAELMEKLALLGEKELLRAELHAERARGIADLFVQGAEEMRSMLALELEHESDEAEWMAASWQGRAAEMLARLESYGAKRNGTLPPLAQNVIAKANGSLHPSAPPKSNGSAAHHENGQTNGSRASSAPLAAASSEAFSFDEDPRTVAVHLDEEVLIDDADFEEVSGAGADDAFSFAAEADEPAPAEETFDRAGIDRELALVFEQEARESLVALQGHLQALYESPENLALAEPLERLYHTLKGASATVGLVEVSELAAQLQARMEQAIDGAAKMTSEFVRTLIDDTNRLLERARLPGVAVPSSPTTPRAAAKSPEALAAMGDFHREARDICARVAALIDELGGRVEAQKAAEVRSELARLLHRLKGSARVVAEEDAAAEAELLEKLCADTRAELKTATLSKGLASITAVLGIAHERELSPREAAAIAEARGFFHQEARQLYAEASALAEAFAVASGGRAVELQSELGHLFHRLKGSALVVAENAIASEALELQRLCEGDASTLPSGDAFAQGLGRISALLASGASEIASSASSAVHAEPVRESVAIVQIELWQTFTQECGELLESLDKSILLLEESENPKEHLRTLMRLYHTLKGVVNTIGLTPTGQCIHLLEDFLESLLKLAVLPSMRSVATFLLETQVEVRRNLKQAQSGYVETSIRRLAARAGRVLAGREGRSARAIDSKRAKREDDSAASSPWAASDASAGDAPDRRFIRVSTERLDQLMNLAGELVVSRSRLHNRVDVLRTLQTDLVHGSRRLVATVEAFREEHEFGNLDGRRARRLSGQRRSLPPAALQTVSRPQVTGANGHGPAWSAFSDLELDRYEDIHVLTRSLTELTNDFNELYTQLSRGLASLTDDSDVFGGIVSGIQSEITRARMVPLEFLFSRLRLPVRDAAMRVGKDVRMATHGEGVHLDKTIADALFQPMLHLVRNGVAHGIEAAAVREGAGKPRTGTITLNARQESGQIVLEVRDDGAGLDLPRLHARGVAMGLIPPETPLADPLVRELVFAPGLSTQASAGEIAGRGVGGDVVRRSIERLNGSIRVETADDRGTTFVITLPLTLAITKALLVRNGSQTFAIPLYFAERIVDAQEQEIVESADVRRIKIEGSFIPVISMASLFGADAAQTKDASGPVVVLRLGDQRITLQVDAVIGQEEIVVKSLGSLLTGHPLFAAVTVRGSGDLVLILDVAGLLEARGKRRVERAAPKAAKATRPTDDVAGHTAAAPDVVEPPPPRVAPAPSPNRRTRVLFVDDSLSVRKVAEMNLTSLGADVTVAVDGVDALAKLREAKFDVVFTDLEMPRMHGYELIRELRFLPAYQDLPIIVVTSRSGQKHQEQARALGASEYITKPFSVQTLEGALNRWCGASKPARRDRDPSDTGDGSAT